VIVAFADRDSFEDEAFADLDLSRADLANREFLRCTFTNVQLPDADLRGARFDDCLFNGCDLSRARAADLARKLVEVNFFETRLADAQFSPRPRSPSSKPRVAARGFYADPSKNLVTGAHVNVETAVTIATAFGCRVDV
jgi:uncharacterized protein YjbI with pentapeptide repeats